MYLNIQNNGHTKSYITTSAYPGPKLAVEGGYIPLTTNTTSGIYIKANVGGVEHRAMEYLSASASATYLTTMLQSEGLSSVTALTRESVSGYATRASTSATLTRASTSATLTRASTSATLTRASTSATLTKASTSATLTRASTSATLTRSSISGYGTKVNYTETFFEEYTTSVIERGWTLSDTYLTTKKSVRDLESTYYSQGSYKYYLTPGWTKFGKSIDANTKTHAIGYFLSTGGRKYISASSYFLEKQFTGPYETGSNNLWLYTRRSYNNTTTGNTYSSLGEIKGIWNAYKFPIYTGIPKDIKSIAIYPNAETLGTLLSSSSNATETIFALKYYSNSAQSVTYKSATYASGNTITTATLTRSSISGYGTRSSISGYGTRSSVSGYGTRSSISGYGTRSSVSGYATRSSISGYGTRISTSATLTCESTSAYSGVSSSSSSIETWQ